MTSSAADGSDPHGEIVRVEALYDGNVQGVGFRYRVLVAAETRPVTGFVRNLPNGRVELVAEGTRDGVQDLLDAVSESMRGFIRDRTDHWTFASGEFTAFTVRR